MSAARRREPVPLPVPPPIVLDTKMRTLEGEVEGETLGGGVERQRSMQLTEAAEDTERGREGPVGCLCTWYEPVCACLPLTLCHYLSLCVSLLVRRAGSAAPCHGEGRLLLTRYGDNGRDGRGG